VRACGAAVRGRGDSGAQETRWAGWQRAIASRDRRIVCAVARTSQDGRRARLDEPARVCACFASARCHACACVGFVRELSGKLHTSGQVGIQVGNKACHLARESRAERRESKRD
jgi:hypothetical protein